MSEMPARLLTALEGRYRIERQLGEGGMATEASIRTEPVFAVVERRALLVDASLLRSSVSSYDVHPDGTQFVMTKRPGADSTVDIGSVTIVVNWFRELEARMSGAADRAGGGG